MVPLVMQRCTIMQARDEIMVPFPLLQQKDAELKQLYQEKDAKLSEKDAKLSEKDAKLSEKDAELKQLYQEKDAKLSEKDAKLSEKDAELKQLYQEKDAKLEQLYQENKQLLMSRHRLEVVQVRSLLAAGRVDLRGVLEHVLRVDGLGTREKDVVKLLEVHATVVDRCQAERKIIQDLGGGPVTAVALGKKLHDIWRRICSDLHPQISPKDWRLNHPDDHIVLKTNPETQSDVLLLYHVLIHFGYPVQLQGLVPTDTS